jgi:integrase
MSVYRRPNGKWVVQVFDAGLRRSRQVGTYQTRKEAKAAEADATARATAGGRETIASFTNRWLDIFPRPKASTNAHNTERVRAFAEQHKRRRVDSITVEEARAWALRHPSTLPALRAMFNDARRLGLITTNPFAGLGIERSRGRRDLPSEWLTATDIDRLADTALRVHGEYGPVMAAMVTFAAYTGIRPGELFALDFADIDGSVLHVHRAADSRTRTITTPKNGHGRDVVLPRRAREAVDRMPRLYDQQAVFVAPRGGRLWAPHFNWLWNPVRAAFGRPTMAFHELRHFCATYLLERGLSPADVAVQLGHRDGGALVMSTYGHPSERAAKARILAAVDGPNPVKGIRRTA